MKNFTLLIALIVFAVIPSLSFSFSEKKVMNKEVIHPVVTQQLFEKARNNDNWKIAFVTGKHGQIVFMNVSPSTNPQNEIGAEKHSFDQVILVVEGEGKAVLNGKTSKVKSGDMIFIPQGTLHNVINLDKNNPLKIISFYSDTDIPAHSVYKTKSDEY